MVYLWGIFSAILVLAGEITQKELGEYWKYWYWFVPLAIGINYSIFRIIILTPNLINAFIVFSGCTFFGRLIWTVISDHPINKFTWIAGALYVGILVLREIGARFP